MSNQTPKELLKFTSNDFDGTASKESKLIGYLIDASIADCPDMEKTLKEVINKKLKLIITSISLEELDRLQHKEIDPISAKGARHILSFAAENDSLVDVVIIDRDFNIADDSILKYSMDNKGIGIITSDKVMALKARGFGIKCIYLSKNAESSKHKIEEYETSITKSDEPTKILESEKTNVKNNITNEVIKEETTNNKKQENDSTVNREEVVSNEVSSKNITTLSNCHMENGTNRVYISRTTENPFFRRFIFHEKSNTELYPKIHENYYIKNNNEIIMISYYDSQKNVCLSHYRVINESNITNNIEKIKSFVFSKTTEYSKLSFEDPRYKSCLSKFLEDLKIYRQNHYFINIENINKKYYYSTFVNSTKCRLLLNIDNEFFSNEKKYIHEGDYILELEFNEISSLVTVLFGKVERLFMGNGVIRIKYNGSYPLKYSTIESLDFENQKLNEFFEEIMDKKMQFHERLTSLPTGTFRDNRLWIKGSATEEFFYQLVIGNEAKALNQENEAPIGSVLWEIKHMNGNVWNISKYIVKKIALKRNCIKAFSSNTIFMNNDYFLDTDNKEAKYFLTIFAEQLKKKKANNRDENKFVSTEYPKNHVIQSPKIVHAEQPRMEEKFTSKDPMTFISDFFSQFKGNNEKTKGVYQKRWITLYNMTIPYAWISKDKTHFWARSFMNNNILVLVNSENKFTEFNKQSELYIDDYIIVIQVVNNIYTLSRFIVTDISVTKNCKRDRCVHGKYNGECFDSTTDDELDKILSKYLGYLQI